MDGDIALLPMNDQAPWPGPAPYDATLHRVFRGRDAERRELLGLMQASPYAALVGEAGIGKTSLLLAGVYPYLRPSHGLPVHLHLDYTEGALHPIEQQAMVRLLGAAAAAGARVDPPDPGESLWMYLQRRDRPIWTADEDPITPVLVFDQFEELFTLGGAADPEIVSMQFTFSGFVCSSKPADAGWLAFENDREPSGFVTAYVFRNAR